MNSAEGKVVTVIGTALMLIIVIYASVDVYEEVNLMYPPGNSKKNKIKNIIITICIMVLLGVAMALLTLFFGGLF